MLQEDLATAECAQDSMVDSLGFGRISLGKSFTALGDVFTLAFGESITVKGLKSSQKKLSWSFLAIGGLHSNFHLDNSDRGG